MKIHGNEGMPTIFVHVASYRDPDCQWTVKDLFEKAEHPERIRVGICWQFVEGEDKACFVEPYPYPNHIRLHEVNALVSKGACWARSVVQKLWNGEDFTLQIDSHMRFESGWDEILLSVWNQCNNEKAVVSSYMPGFVPPNVLDRRWIFGMSATEFDEDGILRLKGAPAWPTGGGEPNHPVPGAFVGAAMLFGPASIIRDVPYDPNLYFFGEEISLSVRLWTNGYDIYHPNRLVMFHYWDRSARRTHFEDHSTWREYHNRAVSRIHQMLRTRNTDTSTVAEDLGEYGLGRVRSLADFQQYSGVDFVQLSFDKKASECNYG